MKARLEAEQQQWLSEQLAQKKPRAQVNPCVLAYGPGTDGVTCKLCRHLYRKKLSKVYLKCGLRQNTSGPGTDHRAGWAACARYEQHSDYSTTKDTTS